MRSGLDRDTDRRHIETARESSRDDWPSRTRRRRFRSLSTPVPSRDRTGPISLRNAFLFVTEGGRTTIDGQSVSLRLPTLPDTSLSRRRYERGQSRQRPPSDAATAPMGTRWIDDDFLERAEVVRPIAKGNVRSEGAVIRACPGGVQETAGAKAPHQAGVAARQARTGRRRPPLEQPRTGLDPDDLPWCPGRRSSSRADPSPSGGSTQGRGRRQAGLVLGRSTAVGGAAWLPRLASPLEAAWHQARDARPERAADARVRLHEIWRYALLLIVALPQRLGASLGLQKLPSAPRRNGVVVHD